MANVCSLCNREDRGEINAELVSGTPLRNIAKRFGTSPATLLRHKEHIPNGLAVVARVAEEAEGETLATKVRRLEADARRLQAAAEKQGDLRCALAAIKVLTELVGLWKEARLAAQEDRAATPKPVLSDDELTSAIESLLGRAAAREEEPHVC